MKCRRCQGGFTLVECVVTIFLLGVGVVGVASMFVCANMSERKAAYADLARDVAEQTLEKVLAQGYGVFAQPSGTMSVPTPALPRSTCVVAWQPYPDAASEQGLRLVALNLSWNWAGPSSGRYRLVTLVSKPEGD